MGILHGTSDIYFMIIYTFSFWGKWAQSNSYSSVEFINNTEDYFKKMNNPSLECQDFKIINDDVIQLQWKHNEWYEPDSAVTSLIHATFVTSYARLKLLDLVQKLGRRCLYFDTDSCVFYAAEGDWIPELGDGLGELTNELDNQDSIVSFVTAGLKQYGYVTAKGKEVCKIRGFTLNHAGAQRVHFHAMKDLVQGVYPQRNTTLVNPTKICRQLDKLQLYSRQEAKQYKPVYTKRVILENYITVPYGY